MKHKWVNKPTILGAFGPSYFIFTLWIEQGHVFVISELPNSWWCTVRSEDK